MVISPRVCEAACGITLWAFAAQWSCSSHTRPVPSAPHSDAASPVAARNVTPPVPAALPEAPPGQRHPVVGTDVLEPYLHRWEQLVVTDHARDPLDEVYWPRARVRAVSVGSGLAAVQRFWQGFYRANVFFTVNWQRSEWEIEGPTNAAGERLCRTMEDGRGPVYLVRIYGSEVRPSERPGPGACTQLQGPYLLRLRQTDAGPRVCYEEWSNEEALCPWCPWIAACASILPIGPELAPEDRDTVGPHGPAWWGNRCFTHLRAQEYAFAETACGRALTMEMTANTRGAVLYNQGLIAERLGNLVIAADRFRQSLAVRPGNPTTSQALARVRR